MHSDQRVVITGLGTCNPLGCSVEEFWSNALAGRSGVRRIDRFPIPEGISNIAGIVDDLESSDDQDRSLCLARHAVREAWTDAGLGAIAERNPYRMGVSLSSAIGQIRGMEDAFLEWSDHGASELRGGVDGGTDRWDTFRFNSIAEAVAREFGCRGGATTVSTGCTGGIDALGAALDQIRFGELDVAVAGATEAPITPLVVGAFAKIGATSCNTGVPAGASRPFDSARDGFVLGEGSGVLILESYEHARRRGATILAEVCGYGSVNNCHHMTDIPADGVRIGDSALQAIRDARLPADRISAINAHGSSTPQNDVAESNAYHYVFGESAGRIPVTSIKSQIGHPLSASNAIELIASVLSLRDDVISPTINLEDKDERCPVDVVGNEARDYRTDYLLKTSSGFSGIHSSLVLGRV